MAWGVSLRRSFPSVLRNGFADSITFVFRRNRSICFAIVSATHPVWLHHLFVAFLFLLSSVFVRLPSIKRSTTRCSILSTSSSAKLNWWLCDARWELYLASRRPTRKPHNSRLQRRHPTKLAARNPPKLQRQVSELL